MEIWRKHLRPGQAVIEMTKIDERQNQLTRVTNTGGGEKKNASALGMLNFSLFQINVEKQK